jgi:uncharacterized BrkB/YihY/UPF0761 family membrane protein
MTDRFANQIVFFILLLVIFGILFLLNSVYQGYIINLFLNKIKNNSGNYSSTKIILMFIAILSIIFLLYWLFKPNTTKRESQFRQED